MSIAYYSILLIKEFAVSSNMNFYNTNCHSRISIELLLLYMYSTTTLSKNAQRVIELFHRVPRTRSSIPPFTNTNEQFCYCAYQILEHVLYTVAIFCCCTSISMFTELSLLSPVSSGPSQSAQTPPSSPQPTIHQTAGRNCNTEFIICLHV